MNFNAKVGFSRLNCVKGLKKQPLNMNLIGKLRLLVLCVSTLLSTNFASYAGDVEYWQAQHGSVVDITGPCGGAAASGIAGWPESFLGSVAIWDLPLNKPIVQSFEIPSGKTLIIKNTYEFYTGA